MQKDKKTKYLLKETTTNTARRIGRKVSMHMPSFITPQVIILLLVAVAIVLIFPYTLKVQTFDLPNIGDVAKETIIAPFTFDILKSPAEIEKERKEAMEQVLIVLNYQTDVQKRVRKKFLDLRAGIFSINDKKANDTLKTQIRTKLRKELSENTIKILLERPYLLDDAIFQTEQAIDKGILSVLLIPSTQKLNELRSVYNAAFERHLIYEKAYATLIRDSVDMTVKLSDVPVKEIVLDNIIQMLKVERTFDQEALNALYELLSVYIVPNVTVDGEETAKRRQKASFEVLQRKGKVIKDTEIIRKHQVVNSEVLEKLRSLHKALTMDKQSGEFIRIILVNLGKILIVIILFVFLGFYIKIFHKDIFANSKHLLAVGCIIILQVIVIRIGLLIVPRLFESTSEITATVPEYLIPTAIASMLISILFNLNFSFVISVFISVFFGIVLGFNHPLFIYSLLGGLMTGVSTRKIRYRWDFFRSMPPVAFIYILFICIWHIINYNISSLAINLGLGIINCIITTLLAMMIAAVFEGLFDITTDMTLVELSDMNHPLLKRLSIEAAGTYNHSVLVANLAESAAQQIDANPLLVRVASYYHDIGKLAKPSYFVENQMAEKNIHNKLAPSMSALIISSHVKEGLELAKKYKLPSVIRDTITQHHGTSKVSFFYEKALEQDPHKQVKEKDFCYPGPAPQTKENAIIMLADSVEAASRSLATSSPKLLRELVKKIIHDKFSSSQLDECNLTFQNLNDIINGFMPVLQGIFHTRIEYPNKK